MNFKAPTAILTTAAALSGCTIRSEHHITLDHNITINLEVAPLSGTHTYYHKFEDNSTYQKRMRVQDLIEHRKKDNEKSTEDR